MNLLPDCYHCGQPIPRKTRIAVWDMDADGFRIAYLCRECCALLETAREIEDITAEVMGRKLH